MNKVSYDIRVNTQNLPNLEPGHMGCDRLGQIWMKVSYNSGAKYIPYGVNLANGVLTYDDLEVTPITTRVTID